MPEELIMAVKSVTIGLLKRQPPIPFVAADGCVPTSGWTGGALAAHVYVNPPADGIQDFDFIATPPTGIVLPVVSPIAAPPVLLENMPAWLRGVRVHARDNVIERLLTPAAAPLVEADVEAPAAAPAALAATDDVVFDEIDDEVALLLDAGEACHRFTLLKLNGWPEVKTEFENKCVTLFGKRVCTKLPVVYRRSCELVIEAEVCWPGQAEIVAAVEDCARQALAAGGLAGLLAGNLAAATAAFETYLRGCLAAKGVAASGGVRVGLRRRNHCGPWKPV